MVVFTGFLFSSELLLLVLLDDRFLVGTICWALWVVLLLRVEALHRLCAIWVNPSLFLGGLLLVG